MAERFTFRTMLEFCEPEHASGYRYDLRSPFQIGQWLYATDGKVAIRVPLAGREPKIPFAMADGTLWKVPRANDLGWNHEKIADGDWQPWPAEANYIEEDGETCETCGGNRFIFQFCYDEDFGCENLKRIDCPPCKGKGHCRGPHHIVIGGEHVAAWIDRKIRGNLNNVRFAIAEFQGINAILFTFDQGGQGIVMPLAQESPRRS